MWSAEAVLLCALTLLSRGEATLPPIRLLDTVPPGVSAGAEGFVRAGDKTIYLITSSLVFRRAQAATYPCGALDALRKLASVIVHEESHVRHGSDEERAYTLQLVTLTRLGAGPGSPAYSEVRRAMRTVLSRRDRDLSARADGVPFNPAHPGDP